MNELPSEPLFLLIVSALVLLSMLVKAVSRRFLRIPPVVGMIALGVGLRAIESRWHVLPSHGEWTLEFLAQLGVAALLFQVGLKSDLAGLLRQLPRAVRVWIVNVLISGGMAFAAARLLGMEPLPSAFVGVAFSATSVGISVAVWSDAGRLRSDLGGLLIDVAELDDLSAVFLMLVVVAVAPLVRAEGAIESMVAAASSAIGILLAKLAAFSLVCWAFARYLEQPLTAWFDRADEAPDRILAIVGAASGIAALAGVLGFSVAVGALFAGLLFSRDPRAVHEEASFAPLYALLTPFFFIDVGYALDPSIIAESAVLGLVLFVPAAAGKILGMVVPMAPSSGMRAGFLLGVSMVPRAEIALLIARTGNRLGEWAVSDVLYGAIVTAAGLASIASPWLLQKLLDRWSDLPGLAVRDEAQSEPASPD